MWKSTHQKPIPKEELDWQVNELEMWIDNTYPLYQKKLAWFKNFFKKLRAGKFNAELASKGFSNLTDEAARDYNKQDFGAEYKIGVQARRVVDKNLVAEFLGAAQRKEYDFMR